MGFYTVAAPKNAWWAPTSTGPSLVPRGSRDSVSGFTIGVVLLWRFKRPKTRNPKLVGGVEHSGLPASGA